MKSKEELEQERRTIKDQAILELEEECDVDLCHDNLPDPEEEMLMCMQRTIQRLEDRVQQLEKENETQNDKGL